MSSGASYCFIINCASNAFKAEAFFREKEQDLKRIFHSPKFIYIKEGDSIEEKARRHAESYSHIIACGGDGTVSRAASGILETSAVLGVIPLGSGNDFAQSIGLTKNFEENIRILEDDSIAQIDVIKCGWGVFLNTLGIGVDGLTSYYASKSSFKNGATRYFAGGLKALFHSKSFEVFIQLDETKEEIRQKVWMVTVANGNTEGGKYTISPGSKNDDGKVEIVVVKEVSRLRLILEFIKLSLGFSFNEKVIATYSTRIGGNIKTDRQLRAHADGEQVYGIKNYTFEIFSEKLPVIINAKKF